MPRNKSVVEVIIDSTLEGKGFKDTARELGVLDIAVGGLISGGLQSAAGLMIDAGKAAFEWGQNSAQLGSDLLETESLLTNALGPAYDKFEERVNAVSDATGLSANIFKQATSPILAMTKAQGFAADEAGRISVAFGQAALDLNSYFNSATGFEDLQSALAGSSETLQKYGINANVAALQQEALRLGLIDTLGPLDQSQRTTALLSLVQQQAADAMGDAARTSDGFANTQRSTTEAIADANAIIGVGITEAWQPWQQLINEFATDDLPAYAKALSGIAKETSTISKGFIELRKQGESGGFLGSLADQAGGAALRNFGAEIRFVTNNLEEYRQVGEAIQAQESIADSFAGEFDGLGEIFDNINTGKAQEAIDAANSYDTAIRNLASSNFEIADPFGNFDTSNVDFDGFFGSIDASTQTTITNLQNVGRAVTDIQSTIDSLDSGNLVSQLGNTESGVIENVLSGLSDAGANVDTQKTFLQEAGIGADELRAKMSDLAESAASDAALVAVELGASNEEVLSFIEQAQEAVDAAADPLEAVKPIIEEFQSSLSTLAGQDYPVNLSFSFEGQDQLDDVYNKVRYLAGADIDTPNLEDAFNDAFGDGEASTANRRR